MHLSEKLIKLYISKPEENGQLPLCCGTAPVPRTLQPYFSIISWDGIQSVPDTWETKLWRDWQPKKSHGVTSVVYRSQALEWVSASSKKSEIFPSSSFIKKRGTCFTSTVSPVICLNGWKRPDAGQEFLLGLRQPNVFNMPFSRSWLIWIGCDVLDSRVISNCISPNLKPPWKREEGSQIAHF